MVMVSRHVLLFVYHFVQLFYFHILFNSLGFATFMPHSEQNNITKTSGWIHHLKPLKIKLEERTTQKGTFIANPLLWSEQGSSQNHCVETRCGPSACAKGQGNLWIYVCAYPSWRETELGGRLCEERSLQKKRCRFELSSKWQKTETEQPQPWQGNSRNS